MKLLAVIASFVVGMWLSIRALASLYAFLDLWPMIRTAWPRVAGGVLGWGAITFALAWMLGGPLRSALLWGLLSYLLFYLSLFPLRNVLLRVLGGRRRLTRGP